jgi:hypothetical protein
MQKGQLKPHQSHLQAIYLGGGRHPQATHMRPSSHLHATLMRPSCDPQATPKPSPPGFWARALTWRSVSPAISPGVPADGAG